MNTIKFYLTAILTAITLLLGWVITNGKPGDFNPSDEANFRGFIILSSLWALTTFIYVDAILKDNEYRKVVALCMAAIAFFVSVTYFPWKVTQNYDNWKNFDEPRVYVGSLIRNQKVLSSEKGFLVELSFKEVGIPPETKYYSYTQKKSDKYIQTFAKAKLQGLNYIGIVWISKDKNGKNNIFDLMCKSDQPSDQISSINYLGNTASVTCPSGYSELK
jgi:hypothetical protein